MKTLSLLKKLGRFCWRREKFLGLGTGYLFGVPIYRKGLAQDGIKRSLFGICYSRKSWIEQCIASSTERKGLRRALLAYRRRPDFPLKFDALVRGLPPRGRRTVARILNRITHPEACCYSPQEQQEIQNVMFDFRQCVFQVSDEVCYYNGSYLLAQTSLEVSVLYYKHGLDQLRHFERIAQRDIVDVGGYHGDSVLVLAPHTTRTVYTFERAGWRHYLWGGGDRVTPNGRRRSRDLEAHRDGRGTQHRLAVRRRRGAVFGPARHRGRLVRGHGPRWRRSTTCRRARSCTRPRGGSGNWTSRSTAAFHGPAGMRHKSGIRRAGCSGRKGSWSVRISGRRTSATPSRRNRSRGG